MKIKKVIQYWKDFLINPKSSPPNQTIRTGLVLKVIKGVAKAPQNRLNPIKNQGSAQKKVSRVNHFPTQIQ